MAAITTRPLPHHFAGEWGPNQVADLEEDLTVIVEDLASVALYATALSARVDTLAAVRVPPFLPPGGFGGDSGEDGADGMPGATGPAGPRGAEGMRGVNGESGEDGIGWPGPPGVAGPPGPVGMLWPGDDGEDAAGWPGPAGNTGAAGATDYAVIAARVALHW